MEYIDEKILEFINKAEKDMKVKSIYEGPIKIGDKYYEFEEREFFEGELKVYIPNTFEEMAENLKELKYPSSNRPKIIQTDETGGINITFNPIDSELDEDSVEELKDGMKNIIKKLHPSNVFYTDGVEEVEGKNIGYFEFKSSAIDDFLYNIMFFFEFRGETMMGTFSCIYSDYQEWRDIGFQLMKSVRVVKKD